MLPFLQPKKLSSVVIAKRKPSGETEPVSEEGEASPALMQAAEDLIQAIHAKDAKAVCEALAAAMDCDDSMEQDEEAE